MYTSLNVDAFKKRTGLPANYTIDGFLASGTWDLYAHSRHVPHLTEALEHLGVQAAVKRIDGEDLGHAFEFEVAGKRYWFVPVMGTAVMSQYAHIGSMLGSKKNILLGVAGGLKPGMKPAEFILPTASRGNESALMYQRTNVDLLFYPDNSLRDGLKRRLGDKKVHEGLTTTCEVMFAETLEDVQEWSQLGYLGVEMEAALMFALSRYFHIPSASVLYVADNLIENVTIFHDAYVTSKEQREAARQLQYEVAVAELLDLPL